MDTANDRLNRFIVGYGAGMDPAGRPTYTGPGAMYSSPREYATMQQTHAQLQADATNEDPRGNAIRTLLDQLNRKNMPGTAQLSLPAPEVPNSVHYSYQR